jgi:hypothetical protein
MRFSIAAAARFDEVAIQRRRRRSADPRRSQSGNERDVHHQLAEEVPLLYIFSLLTVAQNKLECLFPASLFSLI